MGYQEMLFEGIYCTTICINIGVEKNLNVQLVK